jgi:TolA-binding protein
MGVLVKWGPRRLVLASVVALLAAGAAQAARAQDQVDSREGIALQNQILELRQELQNLQQLQAGTAQPAAPPQAYPQYPQDVQPPPAVPAGAGDIVSQLLVRVSALEEHVRTLQGRIDELTANEQRDHDDLAKQIGDLSFKLTQGGTLPATGAAPADSGGAAAAAGGMDLATPAAHAQAEKPSQAAAPHRTPELALKQGSAALARRDYQAAEAAAREVLAAGHTPRTADATYLLARAQEGEHAYKDAAASFYAVYKANPKSARAAEALLGVGNSLLGLNDKADACQAMAKLGAEFPRPSPELRAGAASIRKRAGCRG